MDETRENYLFDRNFIILFIQLIYFTSIKQIKLYTPFIYLKMNKHLFQLVIILLIAAGSFAQLLPLKTKGTSAEMGNYFSSYYDRNILKATLGNSDLFQDDDGVIYVANNGDGILQFDGQRVTRAIDEKGNKLNLRNSLMLQDSKKLMYVSAQFSFGYAEKNKFGDLVYTSLSIGLSKKKQLNSNVRSAVLHNDTAFFSSFHSVYLYKNKQLLKVVTFKNQVGRLRENADGVYLEVENEGLFKFQDSAFKLIVGSEKIFADDFQLDAMYQLDNGDHLLLGDKVGAYLYHTNGKFEKVNNPSLDAILKKGGIGKSKYLLKNGLIPLLTKSGILFLDQNLHIINKFDSSAGNKSSFSSAYLQDRAGDIWTSSEGISRLSFDSTITYYSKSNGLSGWVNDIRRIGKKLYVRTGRILYELLPKKSSASSVSFKAFDIGTWGSNIGLFNDQIILTGNSSTQSFKNGILSPIGKRGNTPLQSKLNKSFLFTTGSYGLTLNQYTNSGWKEIEIKNKPEFVANRIKERIPGELLISTAHGILVFDYLLNGQGNFRMLKPDTIFSIRDYFGLVSLNDTLLVAIDSSNHLYTIDPKKNQLKYSGFNLDSMIGETNIFNFHYNPESKNLWFICQLGLFKTTFNFKTGFSFKKYPLDKLNIAELSFSIFSEGAGKNEVVWIGDQDSKLYRYLPELDIKDSTTQYAALIRSISSNGERLPLDPIKIPYSQNSLLFEVAYPFFGNEQNTTFSYWLEGQEKKASEFISDMKKEYNNLYEGEYTLHVIAKSSNGQLSKEASVKFRISPPWFRSILAYLVYLILLVIGFVLFGRYQAKKSLLKAEQERKSAEIDAAKDLQNRMLPKELPNLPQYEFASHLQTSSEVGGDYYDFFVQPDKNIYVVCGDATGHGTPAGMLVSIIKAGLIGIPIMDPNLILKELNQIVKKVDLGLLRMSLNIAYIDDKIIRFSSAAMPPCYLYKAATKKIEEIQLSGLPLGGLYGATFDQVERRFEVGDVFILVSDGLPEAPNLQGEQIGYQAVEDCILANQYLSADGIKNALIELGQNWLAGKQTPDDITFVIVKKVK